MLRVLIQDIIRKACSEPQRRLKGVGEHVYCYELGCDLPASTDMVKWYK